MKKNNLAFLLFFIFCLLNTNKIISQNLNKQLIGKWKVKSIEPYNHLKNKVDKNIIIKDSVFDLAKNAIQANQIWEFFGKRYALQGLDEQKKLKTMYGEYYVKALKDKNHKLSLGLQASDFENELILPFLMNVKINLSKDLKTLFVMSCIKEDDFYYNEKEDKMEERELKMYDFGYLITLQKINK
jgi:hypothetical protein